MKRKLSFVLAFFISIGVLYSAAIMESASMEGGRGEEVILLHTNDHHGAILPNGGRGGLAEIASYVRAVKAVNPNVLLLDAGDINTGSAISNMFNAEPDILAYNIMGYDAAVFGNHEFDGNHEKLNNQIITARFPFISSNIKTADGAFLGGNQFIVKRLGAIRIGIFGITTLRTSVIASPDSSLVFINEIDAARDVVDILRAGEKVDVVIGITHMGDVKESPDHITSIELARAVPGIDIIVDGHSHSYMDGAKEAGGTWIVSANEWGKYVGQGRLIVKNGKLVEFDWKPIPIGPDPEINAMLKPYLEKAQASLKEVIGQAADTFVFGNRLTRYQETALGNIITDANAWFYRNEGQELDFVLHNGGNIRAEIPAGPITRENILTILPFENYLYIASMSGSQIIELFDFLATVPQGSGGFPQTSADVRYTIDKTARAGVIKDLTIGGKPVDPNRQYRFCTNDYLLGGGDGYEVMKKAVEPFNTSRLLSDVVIEYIRAQKDPIAPVLDGRLTVIGGVNP